MTPKGIVLIYFLLAPGLVIAKTKLRCVSHELQQKNCYIYQPPYKIQIHNDNFNVYDGVWRKILSQPLTGELVEWQSLKLVSMGKRKLLDIKIWSEPQGEAKISSLNWYVYEIQGVNLTQRVSGVIRKKRVDDKGRAFKDPYEKYGLKQKGSKIHWWVGLKKGDF